MKSSGLVTPSLWILYCIQYNDPLLSPHINPPTHKGGSWEFRVLTHAQFSPEPTQGCDLAEIQTGWGPLNHCPWGIQESLCFGVWFEFEFGSVTLAKLLLSLSLVFLLEGVNTSFSLLGCYEKRMRALGHSCHLGAQPRCSTKAQADFILQETWEMGWLWVTKEMVKFHTCASTWALE